MELSKTNLKKALKVFSERYGLELFDLAVINNKELHMTYKVSLEELSLDDSIKVFEKCIKPIKNIEKSEFVDLLKCEYEGKIEDLEVEVASLMKYKNYYDLKKGLKYKEIG